MRKAHKGKQNILKYGIIALLVVFLVAGSLYLLQIWDEQRGKKPSFEISDDTLFYNGKEYIPNKNIETFLVLGLDKAEGQSQGDSYNNDKQADFLMLFVFDNSTKELSAIHINRDTMANVNVLGVAGDTIDTVSKQIALAHTYGNGKGVSCRNTADAVSDLLLGVKVNHYISLSLDSVAIVNDMVGGVEVEVLDDFSGIDDTLIKGETVTLMGEQALRYVRTRYGLDDSTNSTRMKRQQQYINALYKKLGACIEKDDEFIVDMSLKLADYIESDRSVTRLQELAKKMDAYEFKGIKSPEGESKMGEKFIEFYPDQNSIENLVVELFYKEK